MPRAATRNAAPLAARIPKTLIRAIIGTPNPPTQTCTEQHGAAASHLLPPFYKMTMSAAALEHSLDSSSQLHSDFSKGEAEKIFRKLPLTSGGNVCGNTLLTTSWPHLLL